jgi:hypothetical protein
LCLGLSVIFCGACSSGSSKRGSAYLGDAAFGSPPPDIDGDAASESTASNDPDVSQPSTEQIKLRLFHGILNLAGARFCVDPDYRPDDPYTPEDELDPGVQPARPILTELLDGGALQLGVPAGYFTLDMSLVSGALMVYRAQLPGDAGTDGGAGINLFPDAAARDAGVGPADAAVVDAAVDPCDPASLEAVLPFPLTAAWLEPPRPLGDASLDGLPDAGASDASIPDAAPSPPERRGFVTTLSGDAPLTLFGSGRSLDPKVILSRRLAARDDYLKLHAGDTVGAEAAGRALAAWLESTLGPRFLPARGAPPTNSNPNTVGLSFVHLIPDVFPSVDAGVVNDIGSGALHMCVTVDTRESDLSDGGAARFEFRNQVSLGSFDLRSSHRFRLFVEADFVRTQANCGVTSLKPVAEMMVDKYTFQSGRSYTLVAWGARSASDTCTAYPSDSVIRPGCARPADSLNATIKVLEDDLPEGQ